MRNRFFFISNTASLPDLCYLIYITFHSSVSLSDYIMFSNTDSLSKRKAPLPNNTRQRQRKRKEGDSATATEKREREKAMGERQKPREREK